MDNSSNFPDQRASIMTKQITVSQIQPDLIWEDIDANLERLEGMIEVLTSKTDLIILPETFSTGFTMQSKLYAEKEDGKAVQWMKRMARENQCYMTGSIILREGENIYNRLYWISPKGIEGFYDKRHLFRMGRENQHFVAGKERPMFNLGEFRFLPQICYDLRFPVFSRNSEDYDVLFYVANWPAPRHLVWETLLLARAIENQSYVLGTSRVGVDGEGVDHAGGSCAVDPMGKLISRMDNQPGIQSSLLNLNAVRDFREKFPAWKDADRFKIIG
jgi:omega-amidase